MVCFDVFLWVGWMCWLETSCGPLLVMLDLCMQALARGDPADTELCSVPTMDGDQHMRQTEGWQESWQVVKAAMDLHGPFDGIMGFSQVC